MRTYKLNINGKKIDVEVKSFNLKQATLVVNGADINVAVDEVLGGGPVAVQAAAPAPVSRPAPAPRVADGPGPEPAAGNAVRAPIPGAVLSISVSEGDTVEIGQLLLKMEAMKMENQIKAPRAGKVTKLLVKVGDAVAQSQDLLVIE